MPLHFHIKPFRGIEIYEIKVTSIYKKTKQTKNTLISGIFWIISS